MPNWYTNNHGYWGRITNINRDPMTNDVTDFEFAAVGGTVEHFFVTDVLLEAPTSIVFSDGQFGWLYFGYNTHLPPDWHTSRRKTRRAVDGYYSEWCYQQVDVVVVDKTRRDQVVLEIPASGRQVIVDWDNYDREVWRYEPDTEIDPFDDFCHGPIDAGQACIHWWVLDNQLGDHDDGRKWPASLG